MKKVATFSLGVFSALGLLKIFSIVPFDRFAADDFGYVNPGLINTFWQSQVGSYMGWTGRFMFTFLLSLSGILMSSIGNPIIYSFITFLILLFAFIVFYSRFLRLRLWSLKVLLFSCVSFIVLYVATPNKAESWYWMTGSVNYLWPIILLTIGFSNMFIKKIRKVDYILSFIFIFLSVAGNEAFALLTLVALIGLTVYTIFVKRQNNKLLFTMTCAAAVSFTLVYFAPGNAVRASGGGSNPMSWFGSLAYAVQTGPGYLYSLVTKNILYFFPTLVVLGFYFSEINSRPENEIKLENILIKLFTIFSCTVLISTLYMFPAFRFLGRVPPDRSDITLSFIILIAIIASSYQLSKIFSYSKVANSPVFKIVIFLSVFSLFVSAFALMSTFASDVYIAKNYSEAYDNMALQLKNASELGNQKDIIVSKLPESGLITNVQIQYQWVGAAVASYYKVKGIILK